MAIENTQKVLADCLKLIQDDLTARLNTNEDNELIADFMTIATAITLKASGFMVDLKLTPGDPRRLKWLIAGIDEICTGAKGIAIISEAQNG